MRFKVIKWLASNNIDKIHFITYAMECIPTFCIWFDK